VTFFWYPGLLVQSRIEGEWLSSGTLVYLFRAVSKVSDFLLVRRFSPPIQLINDINVLLLKLTINFHYTYLCKYCCDQHVIVLDTECTDCRIVTTIKLNKYHWEVNFFIWKRVLTKFILNKLWWILNSLLFRYYQKGVLMYGCVQWNLSKPGKCVGL
jgi:hypothetical protein